MHIIVLYKKNNAQCKMFMYLCSGYLCKIWIYLQFNMQKGFKLLKFIYVKEYMLLCKVFLLAPIHSQIRRVFHQIKQMSVPSQP